MTDLITGRVRGVFRDAVSQRMVLREIDRIWQAEGFAPGIATLAGGARVTRWAEYEASVDWTSEEHVRRVLRVYEDFLIAFGGGPRPNACIQPDRQARPPCGQRRTHLVRNRP